MRRWWVVGATLLVAWIVLTGNIIPAITSAKLAQFCAGEGWPDTWTAGGRPAWATDARLSVLCSITAWLREEAGIALEPVPSGLPTSR